jgi:predicted Ser/Thr protein kinase
MTLFTIRYKEVVLALVVVLALLPSDVVGQTINVGGKIDPIGPGFTRPVVSSLALNSSDQIVAISGLFDVTELRWYWYRTQRNVAMTGLTTTLVAARNSTPVIPYPIEVKMARNTNYVVQVYIVADSFLVQPISLLDPSTVVPSFFAVSTTPNDRAMEVLSHTDESFSLVFGSSNASRTCIYHVKFTESAASPPQLLYCPFPSSTFSTYLQAWSDPSDTSIFYITANHANNTYNTYKCTNALVAGEVSCTSLTTTTINQVPFYSFGRRARNSNVFFYAFASTGNPVQVVATDYVAGISSIMTVPVSTTKSMTLVESTTPNAVSLLNYQSSLPGFAVYDLIMNATTKQVSYTTVTSVTNSNLLQPVDDTEFPVVSFGPSIYSVASTSQGGSTQVSVQHFARKYCGDTLLASGEQCDSVQYCDTTICQCLYGASAVNVCNAPPPPGTPISSPVAAPVDTPISTPTAVPISTPTSVPPVTAPSGSPATAPISSPVAGPVVAPGQQPISTPAEPGNGTIVETPAIEAGGNIATIVPAVVVPVTVAAAGVIVLVVLLQRKKKKKKVSEKTSSSVDPEDPKSEQIKLEPVNYFAVPPTPAPELGKDSNSSTTSNVTVHNPLLEPPETMSTLNSTNRSRTVDDRMDIPYSELKFVREIGAGAFGKVFLGEWQKTRVALKISSISSSEEFIREAELLITLRPHPNVVQILGISADGVNIVMIMEFCDGGSLDTLVFKNKIDMKDKIHHLSGIAKGIYHLHKNKIVHRDLAARNILLSRGEAKISDFGMSRKLQEATAHGTTKATVGPIRWMAPESLRSAKYSTKSDVWSFGILCWEVLSGEEPHTKSDPLTVGVAIRDQGLTPEINNDWDPALISLMKDCWKVDPDQRPEFDEICERLGRLDE